MSLPYYGPPVQPVIVQPPPMRYHSHRHQQHVKQNNTSTTRCLKISVIIIVIIALVALITVPIAAIFGTNQDEPVCNIVSYDGSLRFPSMSFSEAFSDRESQEYADFSQKFCSDLSSGLSEEITINECGKETDTCSVSSYREGSLIVGYSFKQFLRKSVEGIDDNKKKLESIFKNAVSNAVDKGKIGSDQNNVFYQNSVDQIAVSVGNVMPLVECSSLSIPDNAELFLGTLDSKYPGDEITFRCHQGYRFPDNERDRVLSCETSGIWNNVIQACKALSCPDLKATENREFLTGHPEGNTFGNIVVTQCNPTYTTNLNDTNEIVTILNCLENGTWDRELPQCQSLRLNGNWGEWSEWSGNCSKCGGSSEERTRECNDPPPQFGGASCEGEGLETEDCEIDKTCVTFFAAMTTKQEAAADETVVFNQVPVDKTSAFDGTHFTVPETGEYLFSLSGGAVDDELELELTTDSSEILGDLEIREHRTENHDIVFRDILIHLEVGKRVRVVLKSGMTTDGVASNQSLTSLSVFSYSGLMKEGGVAFFVDYTTSSSLEISSPVFATKPSQFNYGSGFIVDTGVFEAPVDGIFFFGFSTLGTTLRTVIISCTAINCPEPKDFLLLQGVDYDDYTLSKNMMFEFKQGNTLTITKGSGREVFPNFDDLEVALSGFLYDPLVVEPVAFSVQNQELFYLIAYDMNPLYFTTTFVNVGGSYRDSSLICRVPGLYYFYYSNGIRGKSGTFCQFWLMKNGIAVSGLVHDEASNTAREGMLGRSMILNLEIGDMVYINAEEESYIYTGGDFGSTAFMGMLLQ